MKTTMSFVGSPRNTELTASLQFCFFVNSDFLEFDLYPVGYMIEVTCFTKLDQ